ncbi:MAG: hypothetical protein JO180_04760, partial [Gemmatirosa sp.]|nr:hypothetical protein [Gemmatirosa sp.]
VAVVATLRSEFVAALAQAPRASHLRERPYLLAPLGREHLEDVVTRPARLAGITFDDAVVRRLTDDTGSGEGLPLLAFTLARLADGVPRGGRIDEARYRAVGGVQRAIAIEAQRVLDDLSANGHAETEVMATLLGFVTLDATGRPTRRRRRRADLSAARAAIADAFVQARLLTADVVDGDAVIGVAHETLFTAWDRMAEAIARASGALRVRRDLERDAAQWALDGRLAALHWRGERLTMARELVANESDLGDAARAFVAASAQEALDAAQREAAILVDRVIQSGVVEQDTELALLYLLASVDHFARTPDAVAAMRVALARHRLAGRLTVSARVMAAATNPAGTLVAIADEGTNVAAAPSTRARRLPPPGKFGLSTWRLADGAPLATAMAPGRRVSAIAWWYGDTQIAAVVDGRIDLFDATTLLPTESLKYVFGPIEDPWLVAHGSAVDILGEPIDAPVVVSAADTAGAWWVRGFGSSAIALSPDGRTACIGGSEPCLGDLETNVKTPLRWGFVLAAGFSGDGRRLALASRLELAVLDVATGAVIATLGRHSDEEGDTYTSVALDADGGRLVSGSLGGGRSHVWDVATGTRLWNSRGRQVAMTPDGSLVAASLHGRTAVRVANSRPTDPPLTMLDVDGEHLAIDPAGTRVVVFGLHETVECSLPDGTVAGRYPPHLIKLGFSPDGRHVFGHQGLEFLRWPDRDPDAVIARARRAVYRTLTPDEAARFGLRPPDLHR